MNNDFEKIINYTFTDKALLTQAFTHSSYSYENKNVASFNNERLEFLGDAVLELVMSNFLYNRFSAMPEGELTKFRAYLVCEPSLAKLAREIGLGGFLLLGKGEDNSHGRQRDSILSDAFEAVIGAIFIDGGLENAEKFLLQLFSKEIDEAYDRFQYSDHKTYLQEIIQRNSKDGLHYVIVEESGPDHNKAFVSKVYHNDKELGVGKGKSKKDSEQNAALNALQRLKQKKC